MISNEPSDNYGIENPARALSNIFIQGSKHYEGFSIRINDSMKLEGVYMSKIVGGRATTLIDLDRVYIQNVGDMLIESLDLSM